MLKKVFLKAGLLLPFLTLSACSWVQPLPGVDEVAVMSIADVDKCQKLGETSTQTLDHVAIFNRTDASIRAELIALAKNEAVRMRGDTIVPISEMKSGSMQFAIYNCY